MIYFYWMTGLGLSLMLPVVLSAYLDNRESENEN
jgi:hypothetical protein